MSIIYFPLVRNEPKVQPVPTVRIGAQVEGAVNQTWIVQDRFYECPIRWASCEAVKGVYTWPSYLASNVSQLGTVIIGTKTCPTWARLWPEWLCSPPKPECYVDYANWLCAIIDQFHPYAIELMNEPDCRPEDSAPENFGCWFDSVSWQSSGKRYGEFTATVYPIVKEHAPETKLIVGSLMMVAEQESYTFLRGAMDGGLVGDILSYHGYITEPSGFPRIFNIAENVRRICSYIPLACSETSVLAHEDSDAHRLLQAQYLQYLIDHVEASELEHVLWYTLSGNGWMNSDMQIGTVPTPAWELYKSWA